MLARADGGPVALIAGPLRDKPGSGCAIDACESHPRALARPGMEPSVRAVERAHTGGSRDRFVHCPTPDHRLEARVGRIELIETEEVDAAPHHVSDLGDREATPWVALTVVRRRDERRVFVEANELRAVVADGHRRRRARWIAGEVRVALFGTHRV